jgi:hypothetical protein
MKLGKPLGTPAGTPHSFATYTPERPLALTNEELRQFTQEDELRHDLRILGSGRAEG